MLASHHDSSKLTERVLEWDATCYVGLATGLQSSREKYAMADQSSAKNSTIHSYESLECERSLGDERMGLIFCSDSKESFSGFSNCDG